MRLSSKRLFLLGTAVQVIPLANIMLFIGNIAVGMVLSLIGFVCLAKYVKTFKYTDE